MPSLHCRHNTEKSLYFSTRYTQIHGTYFYMLCIMFIVLKIYASWSVYKENSTWNESKTETKAANPNQRKAE